MWHVDEHIARVMFDDRAELEVKRRGLPVPTPSPLEHLNKGRKVPARRRLRRWLAALPYGWDLFCRWLYRLGRSSRCGPAAA